MTDLGAILRETQDWLRAEHGTPVTFNAVTYYVETEEVSGANVGQQGISTDGVGPYIATTAARIFVFSASKFAPYTTVQPPAEGDLITFQGRDFRVVHPDSELIGNDSTVLPIYGIRVVTGHIPYNEHVTIYKPTQTVNSTDLSVLPGPVARVEELDCYIIRQSDKASAAASALGIYNVIAAEFFTDPGNLGFVGDRYVVADPFGLFWVMNGRPMLVNEFDVKSQVKALVTLLNVKPVGIP